MTEATFDRIATEYDESMPAHVIEHYLDKRVRFVVEHCDRGDGLDVGCGTGVLAQRLADAGFRMSGVDPSQGMLDVLAQRGAGRASAAAARARPCPTSDDTFDLVLSVATMHHIADPDGVRATLAEMVRVARPGGRVLVWDHNPRNPYWSRLMAKVPQDDGSERLVPEAEVISRARGRRRGAAALRPARAGSRLRARAPPARSPRGSSGSPSAPRWCAGSALTTSSSPGPERS